MYKKVLLKLKNIGFYHISTEKEDRGNVAQQETGKMR